MGIFSELDILMRSGASKIEIRNWFMTHLRKDIREATHLTHKYWSEYHG